MWNTSIVGPEQEKDWEMGAYRSLESLKAPAIINGCVTCYFLSHVFKILIIPKKTGHQQTTPSMYCNYISYLTSWRHCSTCSWTNYKAAHSADPCLNMNSYATFPHTCLFLQMIEVPLPQNLWKWFWNHTSPCYRPVSTSTYFHLLLFFFDCVGCRPTQSNTPICRCIRWQCRHSLYYLLGLTQPFHQHQQMKANAHTCKWAWVECGKGDYCHCRTYNWESVHYKHYFFPLLLPDPFLFFFLFWQTLIIKGLPPLSDTLPWIINRPQTSPRYFYCVQSNGQHSRKLHTISWASLRYPCDMFSVHLPFPLSFPAYLPTPTTMHTLPIPTTTLSWLFSSCRLHPNCPKPPQPSSTQTCLNQWWPRSYHDSVPVLSAVFAHVVEWQVQEVGLDLIFMHREGRHRHRHSGRGWWQLQGMLGLCGLLSIWWAYTSF